MRFFQIVPPDTNIDFVGKFKYFLSFSIFCLILVLVGIWKKGFNYGIDFTGGTVVQVKFAQPIPIGEVRDIVASVGEPEASVVSLGTEEREFLVTVRTPTEDAARNPLSDRLVEKVGRDRLSIQSTDVVGPKVGSDLKKGAMLSLFYSIILITAYIWLRFDLRFAPGATVAMLHDLTMATGFYLISGQEFTITAVAALLTIAGYSVNDTIVIYDRVRDMNKKGGDLLPMRETINKALNMTLSRTLITAGLTFLSVLPVAVFCDGELQSFAVAMIFGIFVGCYSTIYIAAPLTIYVDKLLTKRESRTAPRPKPAVS